jgi:3-deoxy-D-manno-octulosonate 8-phosphate phosphatase (KDO 8-P phosphatase)
MDLEARARRVKLAIFDVDGVMTDGTLYIGPQGEQTKAFNILDGHGLKMLQSAGIATAIISGRKSEAVAWRAMELSITHVAQGVGDKVAEFERLRAAVGAAPDACSFMGDDLPDLDVMRLCGLAVSVPNGAEPVRLAAHYVTRAHGGRGAVREFCDLVLAARAQLGRGGAV